MLGQSSVGPPTGPNIHLGGMAKSLGFNNIVSSLIVPTRRSALKVSVLSAFILPLMARRLHADQPSLLASLDAQGFSFIEIGTFSKARMFRFTVPGFETLVFPRYSVVVGASRAGRLLLLARYSGRHNSPVHATDQIDLLTASLDVVASFEPDLRGFGVFFAELSPDEQDIAFVGSLPNPLRHGIHLISKTGLARTLVPLQQAQLPDSLSWAPDGREIIYDSNGSIFIVNVSTQTITPLGRGAGASWSQSGTIAYRNLDGSVTLRDRLHRELGRLPNVHPIRGVRWSPDSRYILFADRGTGALSVAVPQTGETTAVVYGKGEEDESRLRWIVGWPSSALREH